MRKDRNWSQANATVRSTLDLCIPSLSIDETDAKAIGKSSCNSHAPRPIMSLSACIVMCFWQLK